MNISIEELYQLIGQLVAENFVLGKRIAEQSAAETDGKLSKVPADWGPTSKHGGS